MKRELKLSDNFPDDDAGFEELLNAALQDAAFWDGPRLAERVDVRAGFDVRLAEEHCIRLAEFWMEAAMKRRGWAKTQEQLENSR